MRGERREREEERGREESGREESGRGRERESEREARAIDRSRLAIDRAAGWSRHRTPGARRRAPVTSSSGARAASHRAGGRSALRVGAPSPPLFRPAGDAGSATAARARFRPHPRGLRRPLEVKR